MPHFFTPFFLAFLLAGCASFADKIEPAPEWFLNQQANTETLFYGLGEGQNAEAAQAAALLNLHQRLGMTQPIHLANVVRLDLKRIEPERYVAWQSVESWRYLNELEFHIQSSLKTQRSRLEQANLENPLQRHFSAQQILQELKQQKERIKVLNNYRSGNKGTVYLVQVQRMEKTANEYRAALFFNIESEDAKLAALLGEQLRKKGFAVKKMQGTHSNKITLKLLQQSEVQKLPSTINVKTQLMVQARDNQNTLLASRAYAFTQQAMKSSEQAQVDFYTQFLAALKAQDVAEFIGFVY